jgi:hypothetical protein
MRRFAYWRVAVVGCGREGTASNAALLEEKKNDIEGVISNNHKHKAVVTETAQQKRL